MPLLDPDRIWDIWDSQKKHIKCIQDPEGIQLYVKTGSIKKGGVELPVYRCARGSTSLESFHLHLNRFIPGKFGKIIHHKHASVGGKAFAFVFCLMAGTSASDMHFQAYLLEGQSRWNVDREAAAVTSSLSPESKTYSDLLCQSVNKLSESVLGKKTKATFEAYWKIYW